MGLTGAQHCVSYITNIYTALVGLGLADKLNIS